MKQNAPEHLQCAVCLYVLQELVALPAASSNLGQFLCRDLVTKTYCKANGYETDCEVIYGDTDSVMVHFKVPQVARAMELGREAAEFVSKTFIKPIKLEFEKVCFHSQLFRMAFLWRGSAAIHGSSCRHQASRATRHSVSDSCSSNVTARKVVVPVSTPHSYVTPRRYGTHM